MMGTLRTPIITFTAAYNHPLLPSESQYVVCKPLSISVKRTLGCAVARNDGVRAEVLRRRLLDEWEIVGGYMREDRFEMAKSNLDGMMERLDNWVDSGGDGGGEWFEMRFDVMREMEVVLTKILDGKRAVSAEEVKIPEEVLINNDLPRKGRIFSLFSKRKDKQHGKGNLEPVSTCDSGNDSWSSGSVKSDIPRSSKKAKTSQHLGNRRESEKLVEEAIIRGEPVTVFQENSEPLLLPPSTETIRRPTTSQSQRRYERDADVISIRSTLTLDQKYPFTSYRHRSRDITPTPTDPFGLRRDSRALPSSPQSVIPSPRKRAGIYAMPRWPRSGRPSPSSSPPSPPSKVRQQGRETFGSVKDDKSIASIYDEMDNQQQGRDFARTGDVDPAELIWRGIDEEYVSPGGGGKFMKWRRSRRKVSSRTLDD
jgi:hypothetical protein